MRRKIRCRVCRANWFPRGGGTVLAFYDKHKEMHGLPEAGESFEELMTWRKEYFEEIGKVVRNG